MSGYNPTPLPDYVIDPSVRKTWDEWTQVFYPNQKKFPLWWHLAKWATKLGFAVKDGRLVYDPMAYRKP